MGTRGLVRIGRVTSHDSKNFFIFYVSSEETGANSIPVCASPSSDNFHIPDVGSYVRYIDGSNKIKRYLGLMNDNPDTWYGTSYNGEGLTDPNANPSNLVCMQAGDTFVGKHGRAYFNGDVFIYSDFFRSKLFLRDAGYAELKAYDFLINTEDGGVSIYTEASVPQDANAAPNFGDSLTLKRTLPSGPATSWRLDNTGSATLSIMSGISTAVFDINGDITLNCGTNGQASPTPSAAFALINESKDNNGNVTLSKASLHSGTLAVNTDKAATLSCDSLTETVVNDAVISCKDWQLTASKALSTASESLLLTTSKASELDCQDLTLKTTKTATLSVGSTLAISSSQATTIDGSQVAINGGEALAYKAALDKLNSTVADLVAKFNAHQHSYLPGPGPAALTVATVSSATPPAIGVVGTSKTIAG